MMAAPETIRLKASSAPDRLRPARVLCVDDDATSRGLLKLHLQKAGFLVATAEDGHEAWDLLQSFEIAAVVTDSHMQRVTGLQLAFKMKRARMPQPIVVLSGSLAGVVEAERLELDLAAVLLKPFDPTQLINAVRGALRVVAPNPAFGRSVNCWRGSGCRPVLRYSER